MADAGKISADMRDLQLLCVGYGLHKETRKQLLGDLPEGICTKEIECLLRCFRTGRPDELIVWLGARGAKVENGIELIRTVTNKINEQHKRVKLEKILSQVRYAAQLESPDEVIADLKKAIADLEKV